jgi:DASS family divalent anion:Na+ symporter
LDQSFCDILDLFSNAQIYIDLLFDPEKKFAYTTFLQLSCDIKMIHRSGYLKLLFLTIFGLFIWNFIPTPIGLSTKGWHLLIIFCLTIFAIILEPMPISVIALFSSLLCILTKIMTLEESFHGFGSPVLWIIIFAFFIARGIVKTGLGKRVAYFFISQIGRTTIGLSYGLVITECLLALVIPSVSARSGGIMYPIVQSIIKEYENNYSKKIARINGMFLLQVCFQGSTITCAMFLTAMSGNPLIVSIAGKLGVEITWSIWAIAAIVPGILNLILLPILLYKICGPAIKVSNEAPALAKKALFEMGNLTRNELIMLTTFIGLILLWIFGKSIDIDSTSTAFIGVMILLFSGVLTWDDILSERNAWDIMIWFSLLLTLSAYLNHLGVMSWVGGGLEKASSQIHYSKSIIFCGIILIYFFIHYFFASVTAHITVFYAIFVGLLVQLCEIKLLPASLILAYVSSLSGGLTHYSNSTAPIFFGAKCFSIKEWWRVGFIVGIFNLFIWGISGYCWWKYLEFI